MIQDPLGGMAVPMLRVAVAAFSHSLLSDGGLDSLFPDPSDDISPVLYGNRPLRIFSDSDARNPQTSGFLLNTA